MYEFLAKHSEIRVKKCVDFISQSSTRSSDDPIHEDVDFGFRLNPIAFGSSKIIFGKKSRYP